MGEKLYPLLGKSKPPYFLLAPMAGVTDRPFRRIVSEFGCELAFSEMVSAKAISYCNYKTMSLIDIKDEQYVGVQIFGSDPAVLANAGQAVEATGARLLDINMGCPVAKIVGNGEGAALMKEPRLAEAIVRKLVKSVSIPVTVKIRSGWDDGSINAPFFAQRMAAAGAAAITVHGRTRQQMYSGSSDWNIIRQTVESVAIPVIGNGDIWRGEDARAMVDETGCAGIMLARGVLGNPWLFDEVRACFQAREYTGPSLKARIHMALRHLQAELVYRSEMKGLLFMRKHLAWYLKGLPQSAPLKRIIYASNSQKEVVEALETYMENNSGLLNN